LFVYQRHETLHVEDATRTQHLLHFKDQVSPTSAEVDLRLCFYWGLSNSVEDAQFSDRDPTGFCNSEPDPDWIRIPKNSTGSDMDVQTALVTAAKYLIRVFSDINRMGLNIW